MWPDFIQLLEWLRSPLPPPVGATFCLPIHLHGHATADWLPPSGSNVPPSGDCMRRSMSDVILIVAYCRLSSSCRRGEVDCKTFAGTATAPSRHRPSTIRATRLKRPSTSGRLVVVSPVRSAKRQRSRAHIPIGEARSRRTYFFPPMW